MLQSFKPKASLEINNQPPHVLEVSNTLCTEKCILPAVMLSLCYEIVFKSYPRCVDAAGMLRVLFFESINDQSFRGDEF